MRLQFLIAAVLIGFSTSISAAAPVIPSKYYQESASSACDVGGCVLALATAPAGKLIQIKGLSCTATVSNSVTTLVVNLVNGQLEVPAKVEFVGSSETLRIYYASLDQPFIVKRPRISFAAPIGDEQIFDVNCAMTGLLIDVE